MISGEFFLNTLFPKEKATKTILDCGHWELSTIVCYTNRPKMLSNKFAGDRLFKAALLYRIPNYLHCIRP